MIIALMTGQNPMKIMWNQEKVSVHKTLHRMITATVKWTQLTIVFNGKNKTKWSKVRRSTHIRGKWQNILTKLPGAIGQARNVIMSFEAWNCLITGEISGKFIQHLNQYILIIHSNFCCKSDAKLTDTTEIKAFISLQLECSGVTKRVWKNCR